MAQKAKQVSDQAIEAFLTSKKDHGAAANSLRRSKRDHHSIHLPRCIHMFWDKGFDEAPEIVKLCTQSWQTFNPSWDIILHDQQSADQILRRDAFPDQMKVAHYADLLRIRLLKEGGGVWVDASCLCLRPLDHWLPNIFNQCDFFAFHRPGGQRLISSWFLGTIAESAIIREMDSVFAAYWAWQSQRSDSPPYFWFHYLFEHLAKTQPDVRQRWLQAPKLSAIPVHQLKRLLTGAIEDGGHLRDGIRATPVQKLTHKQGIEPDHVLRYLHEIGITL